MVTNSTVTLRQLMTFDSKYQLIVMIGYLALIDERRCCRRRYRILQYAEIRGDLYALLVLISTL